MMKLFNLIQKHTGEQLGNRNVKRSCIERLQKQMNIERHRKKRDEEKTEPRR